MTIHAGKRFGRYEISSLIGKGGMGEVYLAHDLKLRRTVALKVLPSTAKSPYSGRRLLQEARAASILNHPNITHIYEVDEFEGTPFIAMEYVDGETLRQRLIRSPMNLEEVFNVALQIAAALAVAHRAGVLHRDIKTENVMLDHGGNVKVLDFGLAKVPEISSSLADTGDATVSKVYTNPGTVMGTINYMSPEQARGLEVDARTDVWSLGVVLYEMLTGRLPFEGETNSDVLVNILNREPAPLSQFFSDIPPEVERLVGGALAKDRGSRYRTAEELLVELHRLKASLAGRGVQLALLMRGVSSAPRAGRDTDKVSRRASGSRGFAERFTRPLSGAQHVIRVIQKHKGVSLLSLALVLTIVAVLAYAFQSVSGTQSTAGATRQRTYQRLTFADGLQSGPTWSPDGLFIAYSSNHGGNFDIWVQSVNGGNPVQVTHSDADDWQPDWAPDGNRIVFRSERDGGGIFIVPVLGGLERRILNSGYHPRWSPDGSRILCLDAGTRLLERPRVYIINPSDNSTRELEVAGGGDERGIRSNSIAWHPDGRRISHWGGEDNAFWTELADGSGSPVRSVLSPNVEKQLAEAKVDLGSFVWAPSGRALYFEGVSNGISNIWKVTVDPDTLLWTDGPQRLTIGIGQEADIALSRDGKRLSFSTISKSTRVWLAPFDLASQKVEDGSFITASNMDAGYPDLSPDGKKLVFTAIRHGAGKQELWEKDLTSGKETLLAVDEYLRLCPRWSPDSKRLAYSRFRRAAPGGAQLASSIITLDLGTNSEQVVTSLGSGKDYFYDWSADGESVIGSTDRDLPERWRLVRVPLSHAPSAEKAMRVIASDPDRNLWAPRLSPDGRWISYISQTASEPGSSVIYVMPAGGGAAVRVTNQGEWADKPRWSADGKTLYFIANYRSNFLNVWGTRFDPVAGKPVGQPFRVTHFDSPHKMVSTRISSLEISFAGGRLALPIIEISGSIWLLDNVD